MPSSPRRRTHKNTIIGNNVFMEELQGVQENDIGPKRARGQNNVAGHRAKRRRSVESAGTGDTNRPYSVYNVAGPPTFNRPATPSERARPRFRHRTEGMSLFPLPRLMALPQAKQPLRPRKRRFLWPTEAKRQCRPRKGRFRWPTGAGRNRRGLCRAE